MDVVVSGGGLRGYYVTGALNVLRRSGLNVKRFAGASAGAWCAAFFMSGCSTSHWADTYRRTAELVGDTYPEA